MCHTTPRIYYTARSRTLPFPGVNDRHNPDRKRTLSPGHRKVTAGGALPEPSNHLKPLSSTLAPFCLYLIRRMVVHAPSRIVLKQHQKALYRTQDQESYVSVQCNSDLEVTVLISINVTAQENRKGYLNQIHRSLW